MMRKILFMLILLVGLLGMLGIVSGQSNTVCCEETNNGAFCQNVPAAECKASAQQVPTGCESTSFCRAGTCFDSTEGICMDNTPQLVCNDNGGVWNEERPPQCNLGCCILIDQAAFVTLVRCKKLSAEHGLQTNYNSGIKSELECIQTVQAQDRGACVYEFELERTCEFTTRGDCEGVESEANGTEQIGGEFFAGKLCSAEELGTNCGPTTDTLCMPGKDEVYFVDSCGNPANIYDASKINDQSYWTNVRGKAESCNPGSGNIESKNCGNCNYLKGSICRNEDVAGVNPSYGDFICADLNCKDTSNGQDYLHGESWCVFNDNGETDVGVNSVGSRFFRHICINGEETVEACEDLRAEECIEGVTNGFSQAACRVNRWQDCIAQSEKFDCENTDIRDCYWKEGIILGNASALGACLPMNPPGLKFWEGEEALNICAQAHATCIIEYEKGVFGEKECKANCECLTPQWEADRAEVCRALGDCGPAVNWIGKAGSKEGFLIKVGKEDEE
jgi:hypothetical protein